MSLNESVGPKQKERWATVFDLEGVPRDHEVRRALAAQIQESDMSLSNAFQGRAAGDPSKPFTPAYKHQEYPKMLYHPQNFTPASVTAKRRIELHNQLHPEKPEIIPSLERVTAVVESAEKERIYLEQGWLQKPPATATDELVEEGEVAGDERLCSRGCGKPPHPGRCAAH